MVTGELRRPIRVVLFGGAYFEPGALRFVVALDGHPDIELIAGFCQSPGVGLRHRVANLWRRRSLLALPILGLEAGRALGRWIRNPREAAAFRPLAAQALAKIVPVPDLHAPPVLERIRSLQPDLGVIYGAPILHPSLFEIPRHGTLGIHHGKVPEYRGKKTTFWAMYNGESTAGVTIQRVNPGIDTGEVVKAGQVEIGRKRYGQVERELETLGIELYLEAILDVKAGRAVFRPQEASGRSRNYRQPTASEILRFWVRRLSRSRRVARA